MVASRSPPASRLARAYRSSRQLVAIATTASIVLGVLIPWEAQRPYERRAHEPELETDTSDATQNLVTPAGTNAPQALTQPVRELSRCPEGMVYVRGDYCPGLAHICKAYIDERLDRFGVVGLTIAGRPIVEHGQEAGPRFWLTVLIQPSAAPRPLSLAASPRGDQNSQKHGPGPENGSFSHDYSL